MLRNSKLAAGGWRDPRLLVRIVLGVLVAANLAAAALVLFPPGGSAEDLQRQMASLQSQISSKQALLERTRQHLAAVEKGRNEGDTFLSGYFLANRTAYLTLLGELNEAASRSKIKPRETSYAVEPIEGSDTLNMLTITYNLDGAYTDVLSFVHELDRSPRLLIIESLSAAPQQGANVLSVSMKLDTFVRDDGSAPAAHAWRAGFSPREALASLPNGGAEAPRRMKPALQNRGGRGFSALIVQTGIALVRDQQSAQAAGAVVRDEQSAQAAGAVVRDQQRSQAE